ncbi:MAG TPA: D-aminoacylase [Firmicutes bacterium]|nr:D-aminoacylase [Bacillota bacterium]
MHRIVVTNGLVVDGSGNQAYPGDIYITGDRISGICREGSREQAEYEGCRVIDAAGLVVTPGFVDIHTHSDTTILSCPSADSKLRQGITTEIGGNCGYSLFPVAQSHLKELKEFLSIFPGERSYSWTGAGEFLDCIEDAAPAINFGTYVGHSAVRLAVKGFERSAANVEELAEMNALVLEALDEGAVGLSLGLAYPPGSFARDSELYTLMKATASRGKIVSVHVRDEANSCVDSVQWVIDAARKTGASVEISHLKSMGKANWGKVKRSLELISEARESGVDITVDVYPYIAINTVLTSLLPADVISGGIEVAKRKLQDRATLQRTLEHLAKRSGSYGGWENVVVASASNLKHPEEVVGKSIAEIAATRSKSPEQTTVDISLESLGSTMIVCFSMNEEDVVEVFKAPFSMAGSDGKILCTEGPLSHGRPHPRNYGAFPRIIKWVVKQKKALTLEGAVRKMTSMPAERVGIERRGLIKVGNYADLTIFSLDELSDMASFENPHQYCEGIKCIIVNGEVTFEGGKIATRNGKVLRL